MKKTAQAFFILSSLMLALVISITEIHGVPFWGAKQSSPADTPIETLKPGEFIWEENLEPGGPIAIVVSLPEQMAYVYRNGLRIGVTTVSTGKKGHRTPTGVFTILNKDKTIAPGNTATPQCLTPNASPGTALPSMQEACLVTRLHMAVFTCHPSSHASFLASPIKARPL